MTIYSNVLALSNAIGGTNVIGCKSGKDRTAMAITLEEGRILRENYGINQNQVV